MHVPVWTAEEARAADAAAAALGIDGAWLMEAAGACVARRVRSWGATRPLILVGPGQNGGDGLVAARRLALAGVATRVFMPAAPRFAGAAGVVASAWAAGAQRVAEDDPADALAASDLVVDAVLGTGQNRALGPPWSTLWPHLAASRVLAVDLPTGVEADTGRCWTDGPVMVETIAVGALKPAHLLEPAASRVGRLTVADIGLPRQIGTRFRLDRPEERPRERDAGADKYARGTLVVVGGSAQYTGAPGLAAGGGMRAGMGYVEIWCAAAGAERIRFLPAVVRVLPEREGALTLDEAAARALARARAVVLGPGGTLAPSLVEAVRATGLPAVVDAGAVAAYVAAGRPPWPGAVFTPHAAEAARLLDREAAWVAGHREAAVRELGAVTGGVVLLKGRRTLVGRGDGPVFVNWPGGPELATAGTGDVLAGVIGGLLARGLDALAAARLGAWWHGLAGERMRWTHGPAGGSAADLLDALAAVRPEAGAPADWPEGVW